MPQSLKPSGDRAEMMGHQDLSIGWHGRRLASVEAVDDVAEVNDAAATVDGEAPREAARREIAVPKADACLRWD